MSVEFCRGLNTAKNLLQKELAMSRKIDQNVVRMVSEMRNDPGTISKYVNAAAHIGGRRGEHARQALAALTADELEAAIAGVYAAADVAIRDFTLQVNAARQKELAVVEKLLASKGTKPKAGYFAAF